MKEAGAGGEGGPPGRQEGGSGGSQNPAQGGAWVGVVGGTRNLNLTSTENVVYDEKDAGCI